MSNKEERKQNLKTVMKDMLLSKNGLTIKEIVSSTTSLYLTEYKEVFKEFIRFKRTRNSLTIYIEFELSYNDYMSIDLYKIYYNDKLVVDNVEVYLLEDEILTSIHTDLYELVYKCYDQKKDLAVLNKISVGLYQDEIIELFERIAPHLYIDKFVSNTQTIKEIVITHDICKYNLGFRLATYIGRYNNGTLEFSIVKHDMIPINDVVRFIKEVK